MNELVIGVDLGSAFTKVGLRIARCEPAMTVNSQVILPPIPDFCFPSTVVAQADSQTCIFGIGAIRQVLTPSQKRYENWKRDLFSDALPTPKPTGWEALFASEEMGRLVQEYGIPPAELDSLAKLAASARAFSGVPSLQQAKQANARSPQTRAHAIAVRFLTWLREQTLTSLRETCPEVEAIPVRVTVPAFAPEEQLAELPGCRLLADALTRSGWTLHKDRPFISEPLANAIGVLTQARNAAAFRHGPGRKRATRETINLTEMFGKSPLIQADANSNKHGITHPVYRAFVIDLGAYTADFALVELDPNHGTFDDIVEALRVQLHSVPHGVYDLDSRVHKQFTADQRSYITSNLTPFDWEDIRSRLYSQRAAFRLGNGTSLGSAAQRPAIDAELNQFGAELAAEARTFFGNRLQEQIVELIFTGGGMNIPEIRDQVRAGLEEVGHRFHNIHFPTDGQPNETRRGTRPASIRLAETLSRGGTALGGASLFFESSFY